MSLQLELDYHGITAIIAVGIKIKKDNESSVGKDTYQNWAAAGGAFILVSVLEIFKVQKFSHQNNREHCL